MTIRIIVCLLALCSSGLTLAAVNVSQYVPHDFSFPASIKGNPFEAELHGEFVGPDGMRLRIPGFYDGKGFWKIRFAAPRSGQWKLKTLSDIPGLDGQTEEIHAAENSSGKLHGLLRVDPEYPHHFKFEDGTRFFLMGYEADWLGMVAMRDPARSEMRRLIEQVYARGFNYVLVNVFAHDTRWAPGKSCQWDYGPPELHVFGGTNDAPDHAQLNPSYFLAIDQMMNALAEKGVIAHMMIKVYNKSVKWPARGSELERRYFRYVVARYQAYSNLVWDFSKESYNEKDDQLQHNLLDLVRTEDAYHHLTAAHDDDKYEWDARLSANLDFRIDQYHSGKYAEMIAFDRAMRARPVVNAEFGYEYGVEALPTHTHSNQSDWKEFLRKAYLIYFAGGYGVYYYNNTAWDVVKPDPEPPGMARWQSLKQTLTSLPYWRLAPHNHLAIGAPVLSDGSRVFAIFVEADKVTINLRNMLGPATARWTNTWTDEQVAAGSVQPVVQSFVKPESFGNAPGVLIVTVTSP